MNNTDISTKVRSKSGLFFTLLKKILGFILILTLLFFIGFLAVQYFPGINIQGWFHQTRWIWFIVRLMLYSIIAVFLFKIVRRSPNRMPKKALVLIFVSLLFAEAISQIALA